MATTYAASASPSFSNGGSTHRPAAPATSSNQPPGTFLPGTKVQVGGLRVIIERYLSEGGFAHVYVVRIPRDNNKYELAVLKRVAVPDRDHLTSMRTEVETMKKLKGHKHVVTYMDSHASQLKGGGYEVFLLMEFCAGGGLIDFMNTRLQHRLTEPEILKIFGDIAEGVATMHYLKPPLLHRDLKVENVLISKAGSGPPTYKVCDFGSAAVPRPAATTPEEGRLIEEDVQRHTTMQYRSPEMIDVWRKQPIDEKADIWALGVLLYKLCYYTTPFEDVGQMAILNASFKYPAHPTFSDRLKKLIAWTLQEHPSKRPNIYEVIKEVCSMRGTEIPIKDIYSGRTASEARKNQALPSVEPATSPTPIGLQKASPVAQGPVIPDVVPMRRGRPSSVQPAGPTSKVATIPPSAGDPFAALDSKNYSTRSEAVDELSKRFPSLDEFNIAQNRESKFPFPQPSAKPGPDVAKSNLSERVTKALADEAFGQARAATGTKPNGASPAVDTTKLKTNSSNLVQSQVITSRTAPRTDSSEPQPAPARAGVMYQSTAVGSSPPPARPIDLPQISQRPIWKVPDVHLRSSSQPQSAQEVDESTRFLSPGAANPQRPSMTELHRSKSQTAHLVASARPSTDGSRPLLQELGDLGISRTRSVHSTSRPSSMYVESNLDYLKDQEAQRKRPGMESRQHSKQHSRQPSLERRVSTEDRSYGHEPETTVSHVDAIDAGKQKDHRKILGHHKKRSSITGMLAGRFSDAFKRFEPGSSNDRASNDMALVTPDPQYQEDRQLGLSPILGSESTPRTRSPDSESIMDTEADVSADVRRERERKRLLEEEERVAAAAAEYRARTNTQGISEASSSAKASAIQARVQSLLEEGRQSPVPRRTAEGYGRYTDGSESERELSSSRHAPSSLEPNLPTISNGAMPSVRTKPAHLDNHVESRTRSLPEPVLPETVASLPRAAARPNVPLKAAVLRTGGSNRFASGDDARQGSTLPRLSQSAAGRSGGLAALLAKDLEGVPDYPPRGSSLETVSQVTKSTLSSRTEAAREVSSDDDMNFERRYPSLTSIQMVETSIGHATEESDAVRGRGTNARQMR